MCIEVHPVVDPLEVRLRMLYPFLTDDDVAYWRARREMGDPAPVLSLMIALRRHDTSH